MELLEEWLEIKKEMDTAFAKLLKLSARVNPKGMEGITTERFIEQLHEVIGTDELEEYLRGE